MRPAVFLTIRQPLSERWRVGAGYGRDDPNNGDLDPGGRTVNETVFANLSWDLSAVVGFGAEVARWRTGYLAGDATVAWRGDLFVVPSFLKTAAHRRENTS